MHRTCGTTDVINLFKVPMTFAFVYMKTHNVSIWIDMAHMHALHVTGLLWTALMWYCAGHTKGSPLAIDR